MERHTDTPISLWAVERWQAENLQSSQSAGGEAVGLQRVRESPAMQRNADPEKGPDSEEDWCWAVWHWENQYQRQTSLLA